MMVTLELTGQGSISRGGSSYGTKLVVSCHPIRKMIYHHPDISHFQEDEVDRCVREGKLESDKWKKDKRIMEMEIFDEVRRQGKYVFPAGVEKIPTPVAN